MLLWTGTTLVFLPLCSSLGVGQINVLTQHYDNGRTGQNTQEQILTPANVNSVQFGKLFTQPLDGIEPGQPLYVPNVFIPALNATHNVVYVATMHDSVYAFDADNNLGGNASPLWYVNFLDPANGVTTLPVAGYACEGTTGYTEFGIQGTPVIDLTGNAIYVVAMTLENGAYVHKLHALDLGTGAELFGGPVTMAASVTVGGRAYAFIDTYQQQRPALLLQGGVVYVGFGSPGCNIKTENGWIMAYQTGTLQQVGAFDVSPGVDASAVWLSGGGPAGDGAGNIYFSTGDGLFDGPMGTHFGDTILKLNQGDNVLNLADSFTPYNQLYFQQNDLDLSSGLVQILPQQPDGSNFVLAIDKNGTAYLLDQNNLGGYSAAGDFQIAQELAIPVQGEVHAGLTYWNNNIYVAAYDTPVMAYSLTGNRLSSGPTSQTPVATANPQGGIVSSSGTQNGIFWYVTFPTHKLFAFDATNLAREFYDTSMAESRDMLNDQVHFPMPIVANGKVYMNGVSELSVFGLLPTLVPAGGNNQSGGIGTTLPLALQAGVQDSYSGNAIVTAGIPVTFKGNGKGGSFSSSSTVTNSSGIASTTYTLPPKAGTYTITASSPDYASTTFTVTATVGVPALMKIVSGKTQSAPVASPLPSPLEVEVVDAKGNSVSGAVVTFTAGSAGGSFSPPTPATNSSGIATTSYTTGTATGTISITASMTGLNPVVFKETVLAGPPASLIINSGNNQTVKPGAKAKVLKVVVEDQFGNPAPGISVTYSDGGAGGSFSASPALTNSRGIAQTVYTAPAKAGTVTITASATGPSPVFFTINVE